MDYKFKMSVIIPIYNVENYLEETLDSVIGQTMDFEKDIQLILINDGSPDNSEEICLKYQEKYPNNIIYHKKENGGVSSARNAGIPFIEGKYVNFLDSDDVWDLHAFERAYEFFEEHFDEIDVLSCRVRFFDGKDDWHPLDYKYKKTESRVVDLRNPENYQMVQSTAATAIIKASAIEEERFNETVKFGEDSLFINTIILKRCQYGLMKEAMYYYRRRSNASSAVQGQTLNKSFYMDTAKKYHLGLQKLSIEKFGEIIPYIQAVVAYDLHWRAFNKDYKTVLNEEEQKEYLDMYHEALSNIDDAIILGGRVKGSLFKLQAVLEDKNGRKFQDDLTLGENGMLYYRDIEYVSLANNRKNFCRVSTLKVEDGILYIEMLIAKFILQSLEESAKVVFNVGDVEYPSTYAEYKGELKKTRDGEITYYYKVDAQIPIEKIRDGCKTIVIKPVVCSDTMRTTISMNYANYIPTANFFSPICKFYGNYCVKAFRTTIKVKYVRKKLLRQEKEKVHAACIEELKRQGRDDVAELRSRYVEWKKHSMFKKKIWLVSDRMDNAGDNGEVFFKYLCKHKPWNVRPIFVISKEAACVDRLKSIGEVIFFEDPDYPFYFLCAEKIISSSAGGHTINPFSVEQGYYADLMDFQFYYLQHGVACADLCVWLNRLKKRIDMFFTSGEKERRSIIDGDYLYTEKQVVLTGQARFDALYMDTKKQILILPTWRRSIEESYDKQTRSVYFDGFKKTEYFQFYNQLINHERLLETMRELGYTGLFCLHPIHKEQAIDYEENDVFKVNKGYIDYNKVFAESAVMVTDYSSVLFDFAYLRKPVVYTQFDKKEFFEGQNYDEGYFDYEVDGFGPVYKDLESTVDYLIELMKRDCKNDKKYVKRVNDFFAYSDKNNSKRILDAIIQGDKKKK